MTLNFGANEALIYNAVATGTINAQITGSAGLTKFGAAQLNLSGSNGGLTGTITLNQGNLVLFNPVSNNGTAIASVTNSQEVVVNGGLCSSRATSPIMPDGCEHCQRLRHHRKHRQQCDDQCGRHHHRQQLRHHAALQQPDDCRSRGQFAHLPELLAERSRGSRHHHPRCQQQLHRFQLWIIKSDHPRGPGHWGANGRLVKYGNGGLFFASGTNTFGTNNQIGLEVLPTTQNTATSLIGSISLTGTPFGVGDINLTPGTQIRLADASNIASQKVYATSDSWALAGVSFGYNNNGTALTQANILSMLTTGAAADGKVQLTTTGSHLGVISLDNSWQYGALDMGAMETALNAGGPVERLWLGTSTSGINNQVYFAPTLGASTDGVYRLGGGGNQGTMWIGFNAFENVLTGANSVQIGATNGNANSEVALINGNTNITLNTRQNFTGNIISNRNSVLNIGNSFALGTGNLVVNHSTATGGSLAGSVLGGSGGALQTFNGAVSPGNNVDIAADLRWQGNGDLVLRGNVNLAPGGVSGTHVLEIGIGGQPSFFSINGVISGAGSNLIKTGNQPLVLNGLNTYTGTTTLSSTGTLPATGTTFAGILVGTDVLPNTPGALGNSNTPLLINTSDDTQNIVGVGLSGQVTFGRDIIVQNPADNTSISIFGNTPYTAKITGGIGIVGGGTNRITQLQAINTGRLELLGSITSSANTFVRVGDNATTAVRAGVVYFGADANGYSANTYTGSTFLDAARIVIGADSLYTGPANNLTIISGPFGSSSLLFGSGSSNSGTTIGSDGANRIIANRLASMGTDANLTTTFEGRGNLTFINTNNFGTGGAFDLHTGGTLRNRTFAVNTTQGAVQFDSDLISSGAQGANLLKTGSGILTVGGTNSAYNKKTDDGNYGTSWFIDAGVLRVTSDVNLGATIALGVGTTAHTVAGLASDVRLRGGVLSVGGTFTTAHQFILTAASGIEVSGANTLTQSLSIAGAFGLTKIGTGTLALNSTNANNSLTVGNFNGGGGIVSTSMTTGTPFGTGAVTLNGGGLLVQGTLGTAPVGTTGSQTTTGYYVTVSTAAGIVPGMTVSGTNVPAGAVVTNVNGTTVTLSAPTTTLVGAATALTFTVPNTALTVPTLNYAGAASLQLVKGTAVTNTLTATALARQTNGMLTLISSDLTTDLGVSEFFKTGTAQTNADGILALPTIVGRSSTSQDLNFLRYDVTNGFLLHNATTVSDLTVTAANSLGDFSAAQQVAAGIIDILALRTSANITPTDGTSLLRLANGGLIMNGTTAPVISSNLRFGTGATAQEALVWISGGQTGNSTISGNFESFDFTKAGTGTLLLSGSGNVMAPTLTAFRSLTVQEGTLKFASNSAVPSGGLINIAVNNAANFDLNGQNITIAGLNGTGSVINSGAASILTINAGQGQTSTFSGTLEGNIGLTKDGNGTLTLNQATNQDGAPLASTYTGGTIVGVGRVNSANAVAPAGLGTLSVRSTLALGNGSVTLQGGTLDLAALAPYAAGEMIAGLNTIQFGAGNGLDITVDALNTWGQANTTSVLSVAVTPIAWIKVNNVTLNAPVITFSGSANNYLINGTFDLSANPNSNVIINGLSTNAALINGRISAAGKTITKIGAGTTYLTNGNSGAGANDVGAWNIAVGRIEARLTNGGSNPLGANAAITLNGGGLNIRHDGDNTTAMQVLNTFQTNDITIGSTSAMGASDYVISTNSVISVDRLNGGSNKTIRFGALTMGGLLGSPFLTVNAGNGHTVAFESLTMTKNAYLALDPSTTIYGAITGNGTLYKQNGGALFINSDNTANYKGGTVINGGTLFFGTFEGNVLTLNENTVTNKANLGSGNILVNPGSAIQFNTTGNLVSGWAGSLDLRSNAMANYGILRMAANAPLSDFNLLIGSTGGPQTTSFFGLEGGNGLNGTGKAGGGSIIALNTVYTQVIDLARIGDGTAFLGSTTNGVGQNGSYNAATLGAGAGNIYRLGAGGSTLYVSSDMASNNVLTDTRPSASLVVGMPFSGLNVDNITGANGRGTVVLMTNNDFTGTTTVNRGSTLEFRGSLTTSSFDTWGLLTAGGLGGTFMDTAGIAPLAPVTLRSTSELRLDYATGLLATSKLEGYGGQGRWDDDTALSLNNSTLRLMGNRDIEVTETIGDLTVMKQGFLVPQRDLLNRTTTLVIGGGAGQDLVQATDVANNGLTIAGNNGSLQINPANAGQLGSDERLKLFSGTGADGITALGGITNGMVAPWIINGTDAQFLTYTADNGFVNAGFTGVRSGALGTTNVPTERTFINAASSMVGGGGLALDTYALRLEGGDITFASGTAAATDRIQIRSGGLIVNGARTIHTGISFGTAPQAAYIFNNNNLVIGNLATAGASTTGQITNATHIRETGRRQSLYRRPPGHFHWQLDRQSGKHLPAFQYRSIQPRWFRHQRQPHGGNGWLGRHEHLCRQPQSAFGCGQHHLQRWPGHRRR
jgi:autotransporter-associated beta strand protein